MQYESHSSDQKEYGEECESGLDRELGYARQLLYVLNVQKLT